MRNTNRLFIGLRIYLGRHVFVTPHVGESSVPNK